MLELSDERVLELVATLVDGLTTDGLQYKQRALEDALRIVTPDYVFLSLKETWLCDKDTRRGPT